MTVAEHRPRLDGLQIERAVLVAQLAHQIGGLVLQLEVFRQALHRRDLLRWI